MIPVEISEAADADLVEILSCRFRRGAGGSLCGELPDHLRLISRHPLAAAIHDQVRPPIRSLPHGSHRVFYDVLGERVVVQRILHKVVDVERHL